jgi:plasmid stabilization system protein ParE
LRYRISDDAERDLDEIFLYWAERASLTIADRVIDEIVERFRLLGEFPEAGRSSQDIATGVKGFPAGSYIIY